MIKYSDLTKKTMPPEKLKKAKQCVIGHYLVRPICNVLSIPLIEADVNPTTITKISSLFPVLAVVSVVFCKNDFGFFLAWTLFFVWNVLDGIDGNIARYNDKCTTYGDLWDTATGWEALICFYYFIGFAGFYYEKGNAQVDLIPNWIYVFLGGISAMNVIFPRLLLYKKEKSYGNTAVQGLNRANYGVIKFIIFNITSINGGAAIITLLSYLLGVIRECVIFYFAITLAICVYSLFSLLRDE